MTQKPLAKRIQIDNLAAGLMFIAFGSAFLVLSFDYDLGNSRRMGPAFFPLALALIQTLLGVVVLISALSGPATDPEDAPSGPTDWRGLLLICGSVLLFAQLLPVAGFLISVIALVLLASTASSESSWTERVILAAVLAVFSTLVFRVGLDMPLQLLPPDLFNY